MENLKKSPMDCNSIDELMDIESDNYELKNYWILHNGDKITICEQTNGEKANNLIRIPKSDFDKLIKWYITKQDAK